MSRIMLGLCGLFVAVVCSSALADKPNGNRLTYLDEPCNPWYPHRDFPKLTTPMWVGEEGVEAVVLLGIDDMRGHEKWEAYLRPILNRLKQIDGRAPVSIFTCSIDPKQPHLQQWLEEGLSLEVHTIDHPCPLLKDGDLGKAISTVHRCIDLLNEVPNNKPVCFRTPCCDSLNTLSPRFFTAIFNTATGLRASSGEGGLKGGNFLLADSSVMHVFTSADPALPRELVLESLSGTALAAGESRDPKSSPAASAVPLTRERFRKYLPADRFFANSIENYPYPFVIDRLCWEFPCAVPSDWAAQHLHKPNNPKTIEDWKAALDCTVIKQGVFSLVFHPHNWIKPEQINELIDHAVTKHGKKVKFLNFREAVERLNKNVLKGRLLSRSNGTTERFLDFNGDGYLDVLLGSEKTFAGDTDVATNAGARLWSPEKTTWVDVPFNAVFAESDVHGKTLGVEPRFGIFPDNQVGFVLNDTRGIWLRPTPKESNRRRGFWAFHGNQWSHQPQFLSQKLDDDLNVISKPDISEDGRGLNLRDLDQDGVSELIVSTPTKSAVYRYFKPDGRWELLPFTLPKRVTLAAPPPGVALPEGFDKWPDSWLTPTSVRFIDLDEDGHDDIVFSNHERYGIWLWESLKTGWSREVLSAKRGDKPAEQELPPIMRADGSNNGFWVHGRNLVWMNEDTAKSKDLVERRSFDELLARGEGRGARDEGKDKTQNTKDKPPPSSSPLTPRPSPLNDGPKSPEQSLKMMQVKPGYRVELVAAEPLVRDPVAFDWGPDGKLWVAEMADYPLGVPEGELDSEKLDTENTDGTEKKKSEPQPSVKSVSSVPNKFDFKKGGGRVRFLEDTDGDGKYDKSTLFLDKLNFPNGVMPWRDGVLISAAPEVLFARDTNGDGRADEVKVLLTGFGEGNQQHRVNGFSWGLDNMVHCANGDSGGQMRGEGRVMRGEENKKTSDSLAPRPAPLAPKTIDIRGRDFRWNPDTGELDPTSGQTQFGRNRDDFGNWFGNNNANPMYHFVLDDFYTRRNPHVAPPDPRKQVSITPGPSPVFPISRTLARFNDFAMANRFTSANSAMVYRDELLFEGLGARSEGRGKDDSSAHSSPLIPRPSPLQHVFISEPVHNLVHHEVMTADGVTFTSRRADDEQQSEFLASKDNWFRPTQIKTGPDGALYIADMYRQVIEHPQYIPPAMQEKLDLRAGHDMGRIYRVVREGQPLHEVKRLDPKDVLELTQALDHPNGWQRDMAHRLLYWQWTELRDAKSLLPSSIKEDALRRFEFVSDVTIGTARPSVSERAATRLQVLAVLQSLGLTREKFIAEGLADEHPAVRRFAIQLCESLKAPFPDPLFNQLSGMGHDSDATVRMQFAYTLGHPKFASLGNELGKLLYRDRDDKYLVAAAMSSIHAKNVASVVANVFESAGKEPLPPQLASTLLGLTATLGEDQALLSLIEYVLSGAATSESQPVMLATVLETLDRRGTSLSQLKGIAPQRLAQAEKQLAERIESARKTISDFKSQMSNLKSDAVDQASNAIVAALPLLVADVSRVGSDARRIHHDDAELIGSLLIPQVPVPVQSAAIGTLARINHAESATALLSGWKMLTPTLRQQVLDALLSRAAWTDRLLNEIETKAISPAEIDAVRRQRLIGHSNEAIRSRAARLFEAIGNTDRQKVVAEFAAKLKELKQPGDATRGSEIFKQRQCAACHKLRDIGTQVGPDLMSLTDKSTAALLTAILDPNKAVEAKYLAYAASTKDGRIVTGMITAETGNSITLAGPDGKPVTLLRADIDEFIASNKSFMPEGLETGLWFNIKEPLLSAEAMSDLITFIQSSGPPPKKFDGNQPEAVQQATDGGLRLLATNAEIRGKTLVFEPQFKNLGYWGSADDRAVWTMNVTKPGKFSIRLNYACDNSTAGNVVLIEVAGQSVRAKIVGTGTWENYQTAILGELTLPSGEHRLTIRSDDTLKNHLMDLKELRLVPE